MFEPFKNAQKLSIFEVQEQTFSKMPLVGQSNCCDWLVSLIAVTILELKLYENRDNIFENLR